jgi:hypothetical protein
MPRGKVFQTLPRINSISIPSNSISIPPNAFVIPSILLAVTVKCLEDNGQKYIKPIKSNFYLKVDLGYIGLVTE